GKLDEAGIRHLDAILEASRHAGRLGDELLGFARMARTSLLTQGGDMDELVAEAAPAVGPGPSRAGSWEVKRLPGAPGEAAMLRQVWVNLLSNAVKYSAGTESPRIEVGGERQNGEVIYHVRDNGIGFDMRYVEKLFGVFQRLHSSDQFEGTGIGLANVRRI